MNDQQLRRKALALWIAAIVTVLVACVFVDQIVRGR